MSGAEKTAPLGAIAKFSRARFDVGYPVDRRGNRLDGKWGGEALKRTRVESGIAVVRIVDEGNAGGAWRDLEQELHHLTDNRELEGREALNVSAWTCKAFHPACPDWIAATWKHDGD